MDRGADERRSRPHENGEAATKPDATEAESCKLCHGTGWIIKKGVADQAIRCICWGRATGEKLLKAARIPARFAECRLDNLRTYGNQELAQAIKRATAFADTFPNTREGLLITGPTGIGKTHIAIGVLRRVVLEHHAHALYYDTRDLLRSIRTTYDPTAGPQETDVVDPVIKTELLILDDLGAERATSWVHDMMTTIINTRYNEKRPIIATSNYENGTNGNGSSNGNANGDSENRKKLSQRLGKATFSRLREMCHFIEYQGLDYREFGITPDEEILKAAWRENQRNRQRRRPRR